MNSIQSTKRNPHQHNETFSSFCKIHFTKGKKIEKYKKHFRLTSIHSEKDVEIKVGGFLAAKRQSQND